MTRCEQIEIGLSVGIPLQLSYRRAIKPVENFPPADNLCGDAAWIVTIGDLSLSVCQLRSLYVAGRFFRVLHVAAHGPDVMILTVVHAVMLLNRSEGKTEI